MIPHFCPHGGRAPAEPSGFLFVPRLGVDAQEKRGDQLILLRFPELPGAPGELDSAVVFLAADESRYVTSQIVGVDGGWTCQ